MSSFTRLVAIMLFASPLCLPTMSLVCGHFGADIADANMRRCVREGADMRISSANAGESYITAHPGDKTGAKAAYHKAWLAFPLEGNRP